MASDPLAPTILPPAAAGTAPLAAGGPGKADRTDEAAIDFEAVFISQMLQGMTKGLGPDSLFGREPFGSMLLDQCARLVARGGGIGLAGPVRAELLRLQEINA
jgi:flagellar protein FlgJ